MQSIGQVIAIVIVSVALAVFGVAFNRRMVLRKENSSHHHQVGGYFLSVVGTLYALVLGLFVVNVQAKYERARTTAQVEANACSDIWNFSRGLPEPERHDLRLSVKNYYQIVQSESWEKLAAGEQKDESDRPYDQLWQNLMTYEPASERENSCYQSCLTSLQELSDARSYRIVTAERGLLPLVWMVIIVGGILVQIFTSLFVIESQLTQVILTVLVSGFIALNLILVAIFEHPYDDHLQIKIGAFSFRPEIFNDGADPAAANTPPESFQLLPVSPVQRSKEGAKK